MHWATKNRIHTRSMDKPKCKCCYIHTTSAGLFSCSTYITDLGWCSRCDSFLSQSMTSHEKQKRFWHTFHDCRISSSVFSFMRSNTLFTQKCSRLPEIKSNLLRHVVQYGQGFRHNVNLIRSSWKGVQMDIKKRLKNLPISALTIIFMCSCKN